MQLLTLLSLCLAAMLQCTAVLAQSCEGTTRPDGGCGSCVVGTIPVSGGTTCEPCAADTFQQGPVCLPCPSGTYAPSGSSQCTAFPSSTRPGPSAIPRALIQVPYNGTDAPSGHCLERSTDIERCGACLDDEKDEGTDCSLLDHYESVKCIKGECVYEGELTEVSKSEPRRVQDWQE